MIRPPLELKPVKRNALFANRNLHQVGPDFGVEAVAIHAQVPGCVPQAEEARGLSKGDGGHGFLRGEIVRRRRHSGNPRQRSPAWTARDRGLEVVAIRKLFSSASFLARAAPPDVQTKESGNGSAVAFNLAVSPSLVFFLEFSAWLLRGDARSGGGRLLRTRH